MHMFMAALCHAVGHHPGLANGDAKGELDLLLQSGLGQLTPWAQQGSSPIPKLPKKKSEYDWAVSGTFPNLEELYNKYVVIQSILEACKSPH